MDTMCCDIFHVILIHLLLVISHVYMYNVTIWLAHWHVLLVSCYSHVAIYACIMYS